MLNAICSEERKSSRGVTGGCDKTVQALDMGGTTLVVPLEVCTVWEQRTTMIGREEGGEIEPSLGDGVKELELGMWIVVLLWLKLSRTIRVSCCACSNERGDGTWILFAPDDSTVQV